MIFSSPHFPIDNLVDNLNIIYNFIQIGGVYQTKSRCGKPNCRCVKEKTLHSVWRLYRTEDGKARLKALKKVLFMITSG